MAENSDAQQHGWLDVEDLVSGYDGSRVVDGVSLRISAGESVALLGRNGVGKTTLVETIMGLVPRAGGTVRVDGRDVTSFTTTKMARAGLAIVPQGRRVFAPLTVEENLRVARRRRISDGDQDAGAWTVERVFDLMPRLAERKTNLGSQLSGGEQQMLSIGRALLCNPQLILLDEPSDGLAPAVVEQVATVLRTLVTDGLALLVVEQDLRLAFDTSDRVLVMAKGTIVHSATVAAFRADGERARQLLGIG